MTREEFIAKVTGARPDCEGFRYEVAAIANLIYEPERDDKSLLAIASTLLKWKAHRMLLLAEGVDCVVKQMEDIE